MSILPFCGTIYNPEHFPNLSDIIAPPYDVISPEERRFFLSRSRYNSARLILGEKKQGDFFEDEFYEGTRDLLKKWHEEGTLIKREQPGLFFLHQFFKKNQPTDFIVKHQGASQNNDYYQIGTLKTNNGDFRVTYFIRKDGGEVLLKRLRIESNEADF